ncbi:hypothetical protein F183_A55000 (plasmid) [Bryobacterales bacterium F-183]|nr:hypothetical protein F183_A55000 [Bryobacterales bacterium F-183]
MIRIASELDGLERLAPPGVEARCLSSNQEPNRWKRNLRLLRMAYSSDHLLIHFHLVEVLFFVLALWVWPFHRCKLSTLDYFVIRVPKSAEWLVNWAMRRVHKYLVYFRDSRRFVERHGIPPERFVYVPFKVNSWERVQKANIRDEGYVFVGGRSRRDFRLFFEVIGRLGYPAKVLTSHEPDLLPHGSTLAGLTPPPNVEMHYNDTDRDVFIDMIAGCRIMALPITKNNTLQAGIGVCIQGMALQKPVVISEALGISDVLLDGQAWIVPPGDAAALEQALRALWEDASLRQAYAQRGSSYALPLGGDDNLRLSVLRELLKW